MLALYACGVTTGLVADCGVDMVHMMIHAVPIYKGYSLPYSTQENLMGGSHLTDYLLATLPQSSVNTPSGALHQCATVTTSKSRCATEV